MPGHGQSLFTPQKVAAFSTALAIDMSLANRHYPRGTYFICDCFAGNGWNSYVEQDEGIQGTPIAAHILADQYLTKMRRDFTFIDKDPAAIQQLKTYCNLIETATGRFWYRDSLFITDDNVKALQHFDHFLGDNRKALGYIVIDPNGVLTPQFAEQLAILVDRRPNLNLFWNINIQALRRRNGKLWVEQRRVKPILELKSHWYCRNPTPVIGTLSGQHETYWIYAIGRNEKSHAFVRAGFQHYEWHTTNSTRAIWLD